MEKLSGREEGETWQAGLILHWKKGLVFLIRADLPVVGSALFIMTSCFLTFRFCWAHMLSFSIPLLHIQLHISIPWSCPVQPLSSTAGRWAAPVERSGNRYLSWGYLDSYKGKVLLSHSFWFWFSGFKMETWWLSDFYSNLLFPDTFKRLTYAMKTILSLAFLITLW